MRNIAIIFFILSCVFSNIQAQPNYDYSLLKKEKLGRGVVVIRKNETVNFVSWRYLSSDPLNVSFNIYRDGKKINHTPIKEASCFIDEKCTNQTYEYEVEACVGNKPYGEKSAYRLLEDSPRGYLNIPLDVPQSGITPIGQEYTYSPNDASIGDVDGDGEYEIILKWDPSNAHDNSHRGYTGNVYLDCYKLNGTKLWRIDMGKNIRAGAHYTQFMVFDLDMDGKAELVTKTADGTIDGKGKVIGNSQVDYRNEYGYILKGNEYLTVFDGETGENKSTILYDPPRGDIENWGDKYGNRVDRYLACVAYLDGEYPSVVMCRGYYSRTVLAAYDWKEGKLKQRWVFDSNTLGNEDYFGQGNHNLRVGDVDADGRDEIIYGQCAIDDDGTGLYSTKMGHGDAIHMTVFDPRKRSMQVWACHENKRDGSSFRDAATGEVLFKIQSSNDIGRCMAADIDPTNFGVEMWSINSKGICNINGDIVDEKARVPINMACWWDGDLSRELLDKNKVLKYDYKTRGVDVIMAAEGCWSNNGSKSTACLQGDILGDWREEILFRTEDNKNLRLYVSTIDTKYKFHTFLEDPIYRISIATQNVSYNQPTQTGFYFGSDLGNCFSEKKVEVEGDSIVLDAGMDYDSYKWSIGGTDRTRVIYRSDIRKNKKIELELTYRGYAFTDYINIAFK